MLSERGPEYAHKQLLNSDGFQPQIVCGKKTKGKKYDDLERDMSLKEKPVG